MPIKDENCYGCSLATHSKTMTSVEGLGSLGVLAVAEASGEMEDRDGLPLRPFAPAGGIWERTIRRLGLSREQFSITNTIRCKPLGNRLTGMAYESQAVQHCKINLEKAYFDPSRPRPKVILALGGIPFSYLTGHGGPGMTISQLRGYVFSLDPSYSSKMAEDADLHNVVVVPTYHPSHIRRGSTELFGVFARDVMRAVNIAQEKDFSYILGDPLMAVYRDELQYEMHPSRDEARAFLLRCKDNRQLPIVYDLETSESTSLDEDVRDQFTDTKVRQIQFSIEHAQAIAMPWTAEYLDIIRDILALPNDKVGHNIYGFDNRVLKAQSDQLVTCDLGDTYIPKGRLHDTMLMWKRWQPELPANLQYCSSFVEFPFAWKHLSGSNLPFYGNCDVDATGRLFRMLQKSMTDRGMWEPYLQQVVALHDLPAAVAQLGLHISREAAESIIEEMSHQQEAILLEMESVYPESERTYEPEEGYKKTPKQVEERRRLWLAEQQGPDLIGSEYERTMREGESEMAYVLRMTSCVERELWVKVKNPLTYMMEKQLMRKWCKPKPLSSMSRKQIIRYAKFKKHEIPLAKSKTSSAEEEERESLTLADIDLMYGRTKDRFYGLIGKYRRLTEEKKVLVDLKVDAAMLGGRVHPVFSIDPTGVMTSRAPGLPPVASAAIRCVVPATGKMFVRWRWENVRDQVLMQLAGSKSPYIVADKKDIHPVALEGFLLGQSDRTILEENRIVFGTSLKTVMEMRQRFRHRWPEVAKWQEDIRQRAHRQNYLLNRFGEIRWFYEVYAPDGKGGMRLGDQAVAASRFIVETEAAGVMKWRLARMNRSGNLGGLVAMARDWLVFEVAEEEVLKHVRWLHAEMTLLPPELLGVELPLHVEVGRDWLEMQELQLRRRGD